MIPIVSFLIALSITLWLLPSKMDHQWRQLVTLTKEWEKSNYQIDSTFMFDKEKATKESGEWSHQQSRYQIAAIVSDDSSFDFQVFFEDESFFVLSGGQWYQNKVKTRFVEELTPLDQPFEWVRQLLDEADKIEVITHGEQVKYNVGFNDFNDYDFRGSMLKQQENTTLVVSVIDNKIESITFSVEPIRPESVGVLDRYPRHLLYTMEFNQVQDVDFELPEEAYESELID